MTTNFSVEDLLFLEGTSALFKAALCLLSHHKKNILEEDGFESVVGYLKDKLPDMDDSSVKQVLSEVRKLQQYLPYCYLIK